MTLLYSSDHRARIDGSALERLVLGLLSEASRDLPEFRIEHRELIKTHDGRYEIDISIRFRQLGVDFLVLVECKDYARPVERAAVQVLADKKRATGAHKAILVATNGFQRGALEYARIHGVALVRIVEGALTYEVRTDARRTPTGFHRGAGQSFVGLRIYLDGDDIHTWLVERGRPDALSDYLAAGQDRCP